MPVEMFKTKTQTYFLAKKIVQYLIFTVQKNGDIFSLKIVAYYSESLSYQGPEVWDIIPLELKKKRFLNNFKKSLTL